MEDDNDEARKHLNKQIVDLAIKLGFALLILVFLEILDAILNNQNSYVTIKVFRIFMLLALIYYIVNLITRYVLKWRLST